MIDVTVYRPGNLLTLRHPNGDRLVRRELTSVWALQVADRQEYLHAFLKRGWEIEEYVLVHPSGEEFVVGSAAPDDLERMTCEKTDPIGHSMCGTRPCCGWPRFLICPCARPGTLEDEEDE